MARWRASLPARMACPPHDDGGANGEGIRDGHVPEGRFQGWQPLGRDVKGGTPLQWGFQGGNQPPLAR